MLRRILATASLALGLALAPADGARADELLAWWSFNNSFNSDRGDGRFAGRPGTDFYFPVILNDNFDDGFWTGPTDGFVAPGVRGDLMVPVYDRFGGADPGALVPAGADDFPGSTVADTAAFLAAFGPGFGAVLDVSGLVGANDGTFGQTGNGWGSFAGTALNRPSGTFGGGSLSINGAANNGSSFTIEADLSLYRDITVSWAQQSTTTGYDRRVVSVSTDGVNFVDILDDAGRPTSFAVRAASAGSLLDGASTAYIRWTIGGATSDFGNNRFDNIQLRGALIPEPGGVVLVGLGACGVLGLGLARRRRRPS